MNYPTIINSWNKNTGWNNNMPDYLDQYSLIQLAKGWREWDDYHNYAAMNLGLNTLVECTSMKVYIAQKIDEIMGKREIDMRPVTLRHFKKLINAMEAINGDAGLDVEVIGIGADASHMPAVYLEVKDEHTPAVASIDEHGTLYIDGEARL